jgi:hypothetical protein
MSATIVIPAPFDKLRTGIAGRKVQPGGQRSWIKSGTTRA